jgi:hypothetical protein
MEGLLFRPEQSYNIDLSPYLGIFANESTQQVFIRNADSSSLSL